MTTAYIYSKEHGGVSMVVANINIRTDSEVKKQAQDVLARLGLDMTTAINLFLRQIICEQRVSFNVSVAPLNNRVKLGGWEGKIIVPEDFNAPLEDFKEYME
jgi:DNA-damage-inducible protein J